MKNNLNHLVIKLSILPLTLSILAACASLPINKHDQELKKFNKLKLDAERNPAKYKVNYIFEQQQMINQRLLEAEKAKAKGENDVAILLFRQVLELDSQNVVAQREISKINQFDQIKSLMNLAKNQYTQGNIDSVLNILKEILKAAPNFQEAENLKFEIDRQRSRNELNPPQLDQRLNQTVSLEFRNASVQAVMELLSQHSGINFILDKDTQLDQITTTIYAKNTTVQEALNMIMKTSNLNYTPLNANTFLIYANTPEKIKKYDELITRSFYLGSADVQRTQEMIQKLYEPKGLFFDERLRMLVVRDNQRVLDSIDKLLQAYDLPMPEVILDIEILEVNRDKLLGIGVKIPEQVNVRALNNLGLAGSYTIDQIKNLTTDSLQLITADPLATLNFKQTSGNTNILANPRIRVKSKEKADFLIGEKIPVITTTVSQLGGSVSESISYLDVGLKLEVTPEVNKDRQVEIAIKLEVSNTIKEIKSANGLIAYQIGTRNANTTLQLQDGETQMLAGLIRDDQQSSASHIPGLGKIPLLGRLFSDTTDSKKKSEIVLLITPRIVRPFALPAPHIQEFISGTGEQVTTIPLRLSDQSSFEAKPIDVAIETLIATLQNDEATQSKNSKNFDLEGLDTSEKDWIFDLNLPEKITNSERLQVDVLQDSPEMHKLTLDIIHPSQLKLIETIMDVPAKQLEKTDISDGTRLTFYGLPKYQGRSVSLIFDIPKNNLMGTQHLGIQNITMQSSSDAVLQKVTRKMIKNVEITP